MQIEELALDSKRSSTGLLFHRVEFSNFISYGQNTTVVDLETPGTIAIEGVNLDKLGSSNGCGKSTIINAVVYAIYNKAFDSISLNRLINNVNSSKGVLMSVKLVFSKNGHEYEILRTRGESNSISILKDGLDITPGKGVTECDNFILEIIGVSYDIFTRTIVMSGNSEAFLNLPIAAQRLLFEELFKITEISDLAIKLKALIKQTEQEIAVQDALAGQFANTIKTAETKLTAAKQKSDKWERDKLASITAINEQIEITEHLDFDNEFEIHNKLNAVDYAFRTASQELKNTNSKAQTIERVIAKLKDEIEHLRDDKCPFCKQAFSNTGEILLAKEEELSAKEASLDTLIADKEQLSSKVETLSAEKRQLNADKIFETRQEVEKLKGEMHLYKERINILAQGVNPHIELITSLEEDCSAVFDSTSIDSLKMKLAHQQFLFKALSDKNSYIRKHIINKTIPFLNTRLNTYAKMLGLPHVMKFNADMTCELNEYGSPLDFGNLSNGEKKRANIALSFAFRDVMTLFHGSTNLMLIDELDGGALDDTGVDSVVKVLKDKARDEYICIYVICHHHAAKNRFDRTIKAVKQFKFSTLEM